MLVTVALGGTWLATTYILGKREIKKNPWKYQNSIPKEMINWKKFFPEEAMQVEEDEKRNWLLERIEGSVFKKKLDRMGKKLDRVGMDMEL